MANGGPDPEELEFRALGREHVDTLVGWAAGEGWNPGLADAESFWRADPEGFLGGFLGGELTTGGSIVSYGGRYGFIGLFITLPEHRGCGYGRRLWERLVERLDARLEPGAAMGLDGVFEMQHFYASAGFAFSHRDLRMRGVAPAAGTADAGLRRLAELPFEVVTDYDRRHFGVEREPFLRHWLTPADGLGLGLVGKRGALEGIGVARRCREGFKIGPLFADDDEAAERILAGLMSRFPGEAVLLDTPENNPAALALAARHGMNEVFGCARMYRGEPPQIQWQRIYGVTTFELG